MQNSKVIAITGPTASGKSSLSIKLAKKYHGLVINADSRQIFRDLNIGTAKPKPDQIKKDGTWYISEVPHYLFGFASLETEYNVFKYQKDVEKILRENPNIPIFLVGGTGLYIDSIMYEFKLPIHNEKDYTNFSIEELKKELGERISELNESDRNNPRRLISVLKRINEGEKNKRNNSIYLYIDVEKEELEKRINERVEDMFKSGILEENIQIHNKYPNYDIPSLNTIGYKEFKEYFEQTKTIEEIKELIKIHTRQYAKRQRTWFKRDKDIQYVKDFDQADQIVSNFLSTL